MLIIAGVPIRRRIGSAYARAKLAEALFEIAREGVDPALAGPCAQAGHAWLRVALEGPIAAASDAALDRFCAELELVALGATPVGDAPRARAVAPGATPTAHTVAEAQPR